MNKTTLVVTLIGLFLTVIIFIMNSHSKEKDDLQREWKTEVNRITEKYEDDIKVLILEKKELDKDIIEKDRKISDLKNDLYRLSDEKARTEANLEGYRKRAEELDKLLNKREAYRSDDMLLKEKELVELRSKIAGLNSFLQSKEEKIQRLETTILDYDNEVTSLKAQLQEKNGELEILRENERRHEQQIALLMHEMETTFRGYQEDVHQIVEAFTLELEGDYLKGRTRNKKKAKAAAYAQAQAIWERLLKKGVSFNKLQQQIERLKRKRANLA